MKRFAAAICLLLFLIVLPVDVRAEQAVLVLVEEELSAHLQKDKWFSAWLGRLAVENYRPQIAVVPEESETLSHYRSCLRKQKYSGAILIGSLALPELKLPRKHIPRNRPSRTRTVHTVLPLMHPAADFSNGEFPVENAAQLYSGLTTWVGVISDRYRWNAAGWVKAAAAIFGGGGPGPGGRIERYSSYFKRNVEYRRTLSAHTSAPKSMKVLAFVDECFQNKKNSILHSCLEENCRVLDSLSALSGCRDERFTLCEIKAHGKRDGLGVEDYFTSREEEAICYTNKEFLSMFPKVRFTLLNVCAAAMPRSEPSLAQQILFSSPSLGVYSSTTVGGIGDSRNLYPLLLEGRTFGESLREYLSHQLGSLNWTFYRVAYHAGTIFWGDPTLKLVAPPADLN